MVATINFCVFLRFQPKNLILCTIQQLQCAVTEKIEHFGNPVLRWMLASTVVKTDPAGNIKPDKEKSVQKIDGIVAGIMALGEWMTKQADDDDNPYNNRGMLSLKD